MIYGGVPVNSLKVRHYETSTNDATCEPSAVQAGLTYYANGKKEVGTGKSFEFAIYGGCSSNMIIPIPVTEINTIIISSASYAVQMTNIMQDLREIDFSTAKTVASVIIDNVSYPITFMVSNSTITLTCQQTVTLQVVFGKDRYI